MVVFMYFKSLCDFTLQYQKEPMLALTENSVIHRLQIFADWMVKSVTFVLTEPVPLKT